jgi:hypothetical protein
MSLQEQTGPLLQVTPSRLWAAFLFCVWIIENIDFIGYYIHNFFLFLGGKLMYVPNEIEEACRAPGSFKDRFRTQREALFPLLLLNLCCFLWVVGLCLAFLFGQASRYRRLSATIMEDVERCAVTMVLDGIQT